MLDFQVPAGPSCNIHCLAACHAFHPTAQAYTSLHQFEACFYLYLYLCLILLLCELILCLNVGLRDVIFSLLFPLIYWVLFRDLPSRILNINQSLIDHISFQPYPEVSSDKNAPATTCCDSEDETGENIVSYLTDSRDWHLGVILRHTWMWHGRLAINFGKFYFRVYMSNHEVLWWLQPTNTVGIPLEMQCAEPEAIN